MRAEEMTDGEGDDKEYVRKVEWNGSDVGGKDDAIIKRELR